MEDEPQGHDLDPSFKAEDPNEIGFRLLLWGEEQSASQGGLCSVGGRQGAPWPPPLTFPLSSGTPAQVGSAGAGGHTSKAP